MLSAKQLGFSRNGRKLFQEINLEIQAGDALRICGSNGSGKTSLLRLLCGLTQAAQGNVYWHGQAITELRETFWRQLIHIGHANGLKSDLLAWENLVIAARLGGFDVTRKQALQALKAIGVGDTCDRPVRMLSQGQRKRVALARLCLDVPKPLWILDEPAASLDDTAIGLLCGVLDAHLAKGGIVVHATHQPLPLAAARNLHVDLEQSVPC